MDVAGTCSFFFQAEDGIRDYKVTGVQTCALPISRVIVKAQAAVRKAFLNNYDSIMAGKIGRAACRGRGEISGGAGSFKKKKKRERCGRSSKVIEITI